MSFIMMLFLVIFFPVMESVIQRKQRNYYKGTPLERMLDDTEHSNFRMYYWKPDFQCPKSSECLCKETYGGFYYNCDMLLFAEMKMHLLRVYCNHTVRRDDLTENIHLLSKIVQHSKHFLRLFDCPADSISDFLFPASIFDLEIHCKERKDLDLTTDSFRNLSGLRHIGIFCGSLMSLPKDIFQIQSTVLETLIIENTMIRRLETDLLSNHSQLKELQFRNNTSLKLSKTDFIGLQNLKFLEINKYPSIELEDDLFDPIANISDLILSESGFKNLPRSFQRLQNLEIISIIQTTLEWIDEDACKSLKKITYLEIRSNPFLDMHPNCMKYLNDTAYQIELQGNQISNLPTHTVEMLDIWYFQFSNNGRDIQTVENFISSDNLEILEMRNSSILSIHEDFLRRLPNVREIDLSNNKLSYLNENYFENNGKLESVNISGNSLTYIPVSLFKQKPYLNYVDLSHNNISEINFNRTENFTSLNYLDLSFNKIPLLPRYPFSSMPNIKFLNISNNNILVIHSDALQVMRNLSELRMGGNKMNGRFFPFPNTFDSLKYLSAESNFFTEILWLNMPSLLRLNLANNLIENLDFKVFDLCNNMVELNLSRNRIETLPERIFSNQLRKLVSLDLSFNRLKNIPGGPYQTHFWTRQIEFLDLSGNDMETFDMEWISTPTGIRKVSVRSNNISVLRCSHRQEEHIIVLDFSYNSISSKLWPWYYDKPLKSSGRISPFVSFGYLEELYLAHNQITDIPIDFRIHHPHLKVLDLSFNKIKRLTHQELLFSSYSFDGYLNTKPYDSCHTLTVNLRNNLIGTVDLPHSMLLRNVTRKCDKHKYSHATILLGHNPFECGCKVIPFLRVIEEDVILASELWRTKGKDWLLQAKINTENLTCSYPESVNGKLVVATETWLHHLLPTMGFCHISEDNDHIEFN